MLYELPYDYNDGDGGVVTIAQQPNLRTVFCYASVKMAGRTFANQFEVTGHFLEEFGVRRTADYCLERVRAMVKASLTKQERMHARQSSC